MFHRNSQREYLPSKPRNTLKSYIVMYRRTSLTYAERFYYYSSPHKRPEIFVRDDKIWRQNFSVTLQSHDHWWYGYSIRLNGAILRNYLRYAVRPSRINWQPKSTFRSNYKIKPNTSCGRHSPVSKGTPYGLYGPGFESQWDFSVPETHSASRKMATRSLSGG